MLITSERDDELIYKLIIGKKFFSRMEILQYMRMKTIVDKYGITCIILLWTWITSAYHNVLLVSVLQQYFYSCI